MALRSRLPEIAAALDPAVHAATMSGAELVVTGAKERVPVVTGRLRDGIHTEEIPEGAAVIAGNNEAWYGHLVEHGTTHSAPRPFLIPALEENRTAIEQVVGDAIRKASG